MNTFDCLRCQDRGLEGRPLVEQMTRRMIVCPECGNKRCPKATWHEQACTGSNEPGQPGSDYGTPPTEDMLDDYAARLADRLDNMLRSLPVDNPAYITNKEAIPNRQKEPIYAADRPSVEPCPHDGAGEGAVCYDCWTNIKEDDA